MDRKFFKDRKTLNKIFVENPSDKLINEETEDSRIRANKYIKDSSNFLLITIDEFNEVNVLLNCDEDSFIRIYKNLIRVTEQMKEHLPKEE